MSNSSSNNCFFFPLNGLTIVDKPECKQGFYCPFLRPELPEVEARKTIPAMCPPNAECLFRRLISQPCDNVNGSFGAQGRFEPVPCPKGFFCPTPRELYRCPPGSYCPTGSIRPRSCDLFSVCPEGSIFQRSFTAVVGFIILDIFVAMLYFFQWRRDKQNRLATPRYTETKLTDSKTKLTENYLRTMNGKFLHMNFEMEGLGLQLPDGREILQNINGFIQSGRLTAIMGPSGAGKSTFLNVLAGKVTRSFGTLKISGREVELSEYRKIYGFVPQDDVMHQELTVRENILHSARIRLPDTWSSEEIEEHVDTVIDVLDLSHVAHSIIGDGVKRGISGGQRKRVNIGIELVAAPLCLCLDEPTSGLDSTAALEVVDILEKISQLGVTILSVIHQPRVEIFKKFEDCMLICPGGRTAFLGPTDGARPYFEQLGYQFMDGSNEADILMDILSGIGSNPIHKYSVDELVEEWNKIAEELAKPIDNPFMSSGRRNTITARRTSLKRRGSEASSTSAISETATLLSRKGSDTPEACKYFHQEVGKMLKDRGCTILKQIYYCFNFSLLQQFRTIGLFALELFVCTGAGLIMGFSMFTVEEVYVGVLVPPYSLLSSAPQFNLVLQFALLVAMAVGLAAAPAGVNVFSEELPVYWRKASSGHSTIAYYIGKTLATIPRVFLAALHFSAVLFYLSALPYSFGIIFGVIFLMFWGVYGICAFISMVIRRESATLLAVVIALFTTAFCGYGVPIKDAKRMGVFFLWMLQYNYWGSEAHFNEILRVYENVYSSDLTNAVFAYNLNRTMVDFLAMFIIGLLWRVAAYFAMIYFNKEKQR